MGCKNAEWEGCTECCSSTCAAKGPFGVVLSGEEKKIIKIFSHVSHKLRYSAVNSFLWGITYMACTGLMFVSDSLCF